MNEVRLRSRLPEIAAELPARMNTAVRLAAEAIGEEAKARAPVATGALRDSIHVEHRGEGVYAVVAGDHDVFYGHMVEHGTSNSPPHPFLIPALEQERPMVVQLAQEALRRL